MTVRIVSPGGVNVAVVSAEPGQPVLTDAQTALDLAVSVLYEHHTNRLALPKSAIADSFFVLSSGLAGEVLQKYVNYRVKVAIFGDFSSYTSKPLRDFMYECNHGKDVFFTATEEEAILRLAAN